MAHACKAALWSCFLVGYSEVTTARKVLVMHLSEETLSRGCVFDSGSY